MADGQQWEQVQAYGLQPGDVLLLPGGYETRIRDIVVYDLMRGSIIREAQAEAASQNVSGRWPVMHLQGDWNIIRFPHEMVVRRIS